MGYRILTRDEHFQTSGPKRILALDGGGLRGIFSLGILSHIEELLGERHGDAEGFRLCHYFDLIAGTSTGAIIAAGLAKGMRVQEIVDQYVTLGESVFERGWFRRGILRARYDDEKLSQQLQVVFGSETTLGSDALKTGLMIVTKRMDTGSPWPLGNNPGGQFFRAPDDEDWISNADYPLWQVVRASTAAPSYFDPERIKISEAPRRKPVIGEFVDGGASPYNNPAVQALLYATLSGFKVNWPLGADRLLLVSVGTGAADPSKAPARIAAENAVKSLLSLMDDCAAHMELLLQWMSDSPTAREIDGEVGDLSQDILGPSPLLTYLRYNLALTPDAVTELNPALARNQIEGLSAMDDPGNLGPLKDLGERAAKDQVKQSHFADRFDLTH